MGEQVSKHDRRNLSYRVALPDAFRRSLLTETSLSHDELGLPWERKRSWRGKNLAD
jgi:hypothetical protein